MPPTLDDLIKFAGSIAREDERIARDEQELAARKERQEASKRQLAHMVAELAYANGRAAAMATLEAWYPGSRKTSGPHLFKHCMAESLADVYTAPFSSWPADPPRAYEVTEKNLRLALQDLGELASGSRRTSSTIIPEETSEGSIHKRIKELFEAHPFDVFTVPEILSRLGLGSDKEAAVRQAIRRLFEQRHVIKETRGSYSYNHAKILESSEQSE